VAPRDPAKTARNAVIKQMTTTLRGMLPEVLAATGLESEASLNATIGGKAAEFIDLHHEVILSPDQYVTLYLRGFRAAMSPPTAPYPNAHRRNYEMLRSSESAQRYFMLFLKRSYLKHFDELSRTRPHLSESELWIGQNKAEYGLLITPWFKDPTKEWKNDRSEIRHFPKRYWTIGHVLRTGLVTPSDADKIEFGSVDDYLKFFKNVLVRASGSPHEKAIAQEYVSFVRAASEPEDVPLLIPEFRYDGLAAKHRYRLDFCIINPFTMHRIGYELSPWSTHGYLKKIKGLTQAQINAMAQDNFEKEMSKHKSFFKKHNIYALIYTDVDLAKPESVFADMRRHLEPVDQVVQLDLDLLENFFK
jgi:hypothetical protein